MTDETVNHIKEDIQQLEGLAHDEYKSALLDVQRMVFKVMQDQTILPELQGRVIKLNLDQMILKAK